MILGGFEMKLKRELMGLVVAVAISLTSVIPALAAEGEDPVLTTRLVDNCNS